MCLNMATDGPCAGHKCDNCRICRSGVCCRRDDPDRKLPELGSWDGPVYGDLGVLYNDGEKAQCHICGEFYGHLGAHISRTHGVWPEEYKAMFGLRVKDSLIGPALHALRSQISKDTNSVGVLLEMLPETLAAMTPEQRSVWSSKNRVRLASRLDPNWRAARSVAGRAGAAGLARRVAAGEASWSPGPGPENGKRGREKWHRMLGDKSVKDEWRHRISASRGGLTTVVLHCSICGTEMTVPEWSGKARRSKNPTCSKECDSERRRRLAIELNVSKRPEVRAKISATKKARNASRERGLDQGVP